MRKHKHHIIPRHMGGKDDASNLIEVSVEEHSEIHRKLFEKHGRWQDFVAYRALSGQITHYEATIEAIKRTQTGRIRTEKEIENLRQKRLGKKHSEETKRKISISNKNNNRLITDDHKKILSETHRGKTLSSSHKEILRSTHLGKPKSKEQRFKMSQAAKARWNKKKEGELTSR